jgi:probable phosphoglycerate mutase
VTRILVVRHGQSEWNAAGRWQGRADIPLTDLGREQARLAAERVGAVDVIVASTMQRASETASIIAEQIGVGPVLTHEGFAERDVGEWSGLTRAEIEQAWPGFLAEGRRPESFEPTDRFLARVDAALAAVDEAHRGADVLVVAHGGVIRGLEDHHGVGGERIPNLSGRAFRHHGDRLEPEERVVLVDDDHTTVPHQL